MSGGTIGALRSVWRNEAVRRAQIALAGSTIGDWSYGVALSVLVFERSGAAWVGVAQVCRLLPAAIAAPLLASLVDRFEKPRLLFATDAARAALMGGICVLAAVGAPILAILALATANTIVATLFWPAQGALLPTLVSEPDELTTANVTASTVASTGGILGPALGGVALATFGVTLAFVVPIVAYALSALAVTRVRVPVRGPEEVPLSDESEALPESGGGRFGGLAAILRDGDVRVLLGLYCGQVLVAGALNVLVVVAALDLLHRGDGGVGLLLAAVGVGGLVGAVPAIALSQRARLTTVFGTGLLLWGAPIALIGVAPSTPLAVAMLALVGVGNTLVDVSAITLLQRATPKELLGRVFGILESAIIASIAIGAALVPVLLRVVDVRGALVATGALLPLAMVLLWRRLRRVDAKRPDLRRLELLRRDAIFGKLPDAILEQLAAALEPVSVTAGTVLFRSGDAGDLYYLIDSGSMRVAVPGGSSRVLDAGDGFGEIALIRRVPRTATLTAETDAQLLALRGDEFVSAVSGHATSAEAADAVIASRLLTLRPSLASV